MSDAKPAAGSAFVRDQLQLDRIDAIAERYRADKTLRTQLAADEDATETLAEFGLETPPNMELRVAANTEEVVHFVFPPDSNIDLEDEKLAAVSGGARQSTASSASCIACIPSTVSCGACLSTVHPDG